ncbi:MAG: ATP-dependent sacrificial sulfur transferase LarE [Magnetococcales bacterium]|nr:ATP-dependent sacrificial sulfur transferase LarE [Magnetococcales bacterium]
MDQDRQRLHQVLSRFDALLVAFSGGVDSTCLVAEARHVLGRDRVVALLGQSPTLPRAEYDDAIALAEKIDVPLVIRETGEMNNSRFAQNGPDRCFHCKTSLFILCKQVVSEQKQPQRWAIAYGANQDDLGDDRPGMIAARQQGIHAPLLDAQLGKVAIRRLSRLRGLPTADKAAFACLSSRIPYHTPITLENLKRVEQAEMVLRQAGFHQFRVRDHGVKARIELDTEGLARVGAESVLRATLCDAVRRCGYAEVIIDPNGYQMGGANATRSDTVVQP